MDYLQPLLAVIMVFGLLGAALWWLKKRGMASFSITPKARAAAVLSQAERLPLSATHSLHLVRMGDRAILIASWPGGCQAVESTPWEQLAKARKENSL